MDKNFVNYDIALKMRELGFNDKCIATIDSRNMIILKGQREQPCYIFIPVPTWSGCFDWFREKHNCIISVYSNASGYLWESHDSVGGTQREWSNYTGPNESGVWDNFYEARKNAILTNLDIIKNKLRTSKRN